MSNESNEDYWLRMFLWMGIPIAVLAILYQAAIAIEKHLFQPTFKFCTWYLTNYGWLSAKLIFLCVVIYSGFKFYFKSIDRLTGLFETETTKLDQKILDLQCVEIEIREKLSRMTQVNVEQNDKILRLIEEVKSLTDQNKILESENERLKDPTTYAFRQKSKIQKEYAENLKASIHQTYWRETK